MAAHTVLAETQMGAAFAEGTGHWTWVRDEGFWEMLESRLGYLGSRYMSFMDSVVRGKPQYWFRMVDNNRLEVRTVDNWRDTTEVIHVGTEGADTCVTGPDGVSYTGRVRNAWETDARLVTQISGQSPSGSLMDAVSTREIIDGEYYSRMEDKTRGCACARVFKRWPYYRIDNRTGRFVTLATYSTMDFIYMAKAMVVEMRPGVSFVDASGPDEEAEQAVFMLPNKSTYQGVIIEAFSTYVLTPEMFEFVPPLESGDLDSGDKSDVRHAG